MKGLLLIYGDFEQLKKHVIEDPDALYALEQIRGLADVDFTLPALTLAMRRGLGLPEKQAFDWHIDPPFAA